MTAIAELIDVRSVASHDGDVPCSMSIARGEMVALTGRNGAGKTVTLKVFAGFAPLFSGRVELEGRDISRFSPQRRAVMGISFVPQDRRVFAGLTVDQNLRLGAYQFRRRDRALFRSVRERVLELFPPLAPRSAQPADSLSSGHQTLLAIGRALMSEPRLLLLDEPFGRLTDDAAGNMASTMTTLQQEGVTIIFAEQNLAVSEPIADRVLVIDAGRVVSEVDARR